MSGPRKGARIAALGLTAALSAAGCGSPAPTAERSPSANAERSWNDPVPALESLELPQQGTASLASVARGADGRVRLSWVERDDRDGPARLLLAELLEPPTSTEALRFGPRRLVAEGDDWFVNWADFPATAALADGTLCAAWLQRNGSGTYHYGVRFALSRDQGQSWSEPRWLHSDRSPAEHGFVSLAPLDGTRFLAVWLDGRKAAGEDSPESEHESEPKSDHGGAMALWSRTIAADGTLGPEEELDPRVCDCCQTSLVRDRDGVLRTAWRDRSATEVRDIAWSAFDGQRWTDPAAVHADGWELPGCPVNGPRLVPADPARGHSAVCVWYTGGERLGVYARSLDPDAPPPLRLEDEPTEGRVEALRLGDGRILTAWLEHGPDGPEWRARCLDPGRALHAFPAFSLGATDSSRGSGFLRAAPTERGALAAWSDLATGRLEVVHVTFD